MLFFPSRERYIYVYLVRKAVIASHDAMSGALDDVYEGCDVDGGGRRFMK